MCEIYSVRLSYFVEVACLTGVLLQLSDKYTCNIVYVLNEWKDVWVREFRSDGYILVDLY